MKKRYLEAQIKAAGDQGGTVRVIASTAAIDRQGESIDPAGWDFANFVKNPQLLWSHDAYALPIGKVVKVWTENGLVMADAQFAEAENPFAATVAKLVRGGYINAVSVGFLPTEMDNSGNVTKQELLELSFVNIPANQEALVLQRGASPELMKEFRALETKAFESARHVEKKEAVKQADDTTDQAIDSMEPLLTGMLDLLQKLDAAYEDGDTQACGDICNQMDASMTQMATLMDSLRSAMGGKSIDGVRQKEGRVMSEKNRNEVRLMVDACKQAADSGQKLLDATNPPEKKGGINSTKAGEASAKLRALRIAARATEILIQAEKEAIAATQNGGVKL